jgi:hypothetical protein
MIFIPEYWGTTPNNHEFPDLPRPIETFTMVIFALIIYILLKYRKKKEPSQNEWLEKIFPKKKG